MYPVTATQMKRTLKNWRHYWQEDFIEEKSSSKLSYLLFVSIAMKLVILLQDVHRRRLTRKEASKKVERKKMQKTIETKARSHATLLMNMTLMKMTMKWFMLQ